MQLIVVCKPYQTNILTDIKTKFYLLNFSNCNINVLIFHSNWKFPFEIQTFLFALPILMLVVINFNMLNSVGFKIGVCAFLFGCCKCDCETQQITVTEQFRRLFMILSHLAQCTY